MRRIFGIALVVLLSGMGAVAGYYGTAAYLGARGSLEGMNHVCHTLQIAEREQIITREQRVAIVEQMMRGVPQAAGENSSSDSTGLIEYLKGDCSRSVWQAITKT